MESKSEAKTEKERRVLATKFYCEQCEKNDIEICSWETCSGHQDFVEGRIDQTQLAERAAEDVQNLSHLFANYSIARKQDQPVSDEEAEKRERAKIANKIYKKACNDSGVSFCFFKNFLTWNDFVKGNMKDSEFYESAITEIRKMAESGEFPATSSDT